MNIWLCLYYTKQQIKNTGFHSLYSSSYPQATQIYVAYCLIGYPSIFTNILGQWITYFKLNFCYPDLHVNYGIQLLIILRLNPANVITEEIRAHAASVYNWHMRQVALEKGHWIKQDDIYDSDLKTIKCWPDTFEYHC